MIITKANFFSVRHAISSWGEQLWVLKSSSKLNRFPASRPTSTRPSGLVWSLGMVWLVWLAILAVGCSSAGVWETFLWWIGFNCSSGLVLLVPYMCNNNLMITGSRREPRSLRAGIQRWPTSQPIWIYRLLPCLEVIHYVAPPKIKSTDDFASRIEARSARAAIGQVGNYTIWALLVVAIQNNGGNKEDPIPLQQNLIVSCRTLFWGRD